MLPDKPSELLALALADLALAEAHPKYRVDMSTFLQKQREYSGVVCHVCLAGAVMANRLRRDSISDPRSTNCEMFPSYGEGEERKLWALNNFRRGYCSGAFADLGKDRRIGKKFDRKVVDYKDDPKLWRKQMNKLVKDLKAAGY